MEAFVKIPISLPDLESDVRKIRQILEAIHRAVRLVFFNHNFEEIKMLQITDIQKATLHIEPVDVRGNPAVLAGVPVWAVSDSTILSLVVAADGLSAVIAAVGPDGNSQVSVTADTGTHTIGGQLDVVVVSSEATALNISADAPENQ